MPDARERRENMAVAEAVVKAAQGLRIFNQVSSDKLLTVYMCTHLHYSSGCHHSTPCNCIVYCPALETGAMALIIAVQPYKVHAR